MKRTFSVFLPLIFLLMSGHAMAAQLPSFDVETACQKEASRLFAGHEDAIHNWFQVCLNTQKLTHDTLEESLSSKNPPPAEDVSYCRVRALTEEKAFNGMFQCIMDLARDRQVDHASEVIGAVPTNGCEQTTMSDAAYDHCRATELSMELMFYRHGAPGLSDAAFDTCLDAYRRSRRHFFSDLFSCFGNARLSH